MLGLLTLLGMMVWEQTSSNTDASRPQAKPKSQRGTAVKPPTDFETDKRLDQTLTISSLRQEHALLWTRIDRRTGIEIEREDAAREFDDVPIALGGNDVSARAWMDAIAARVLARWEKTERSGYRFVVGDGELDFVYGAKDASRAAQLQAWSDFARQMQHLPPEQQAQLLSGNPYPVSELPDGMRQSLLEMMEALARGQESRGIGNQEPARLPMQATVAIERRPNNGFDVYKVRPGNGASYGGVFSVNNYEEKKRERMASLDKDAVYQPVHNEIKPEAAKKLPALKRVVSINIRNATFPDVLKRLYTTYGIAFVSDAPRSMPQKADVRFSALPLGDLLDHLTEIYPGTEWEWRKYGVLVVRGAENVASRKRRENALAARRTKAEKKAEPTP
jgi:hypothetical protein